MKLNFSRIGFFVVVALVAGVIGGGIIRDSSGLNMPYRVILLSKSSLSQTKVLSVWPGVQQPFLIEVPAEVYFEAVGGYGNYRVNDLLSMGKVEGVGDKLLKDSLGFTLGSPVEDVFWYKGDNFSIRQLQWQQLAMAATGKKSVLRAVRVVGWLQKVSLANLDTIQLAQSSVIAEKTEADGSVRTYIEPNLLDTILQKKIVTIWPEAADIQVAVINVSQQSLMAAKWSRLARLNGFDVVSVTDAPTESDKTKLIFSSKELQKSEAGKVLAKLYPFAQGMVEETDSYRADAVLLVGIDGWQWLMDRQAYLRD